MCWDKGNLIRKVKAAHRSKGKRENYLVFPISKQTSSHFQESRASVHTVFTYCALAWEEQPCIPFLYFSFYCWAQPYMVWNIHLFSLFQLCCLCPLPTSCPPPSTSPWVGKKTLTLCNHCPSVAKKMVCYQHCSINAQHSTFMGCLEEN